MDLFQTILLALIQGISEFLPVSSSAHLILPSQLLGWPDQGLAFDVAVHVGSLLAVVTYFRHDLMSIALACWKSCSLPSNQLSNIQCEQARFGWQALLATLPAVVIALFAKDFIAENLRTTWVIATTTILFGLLLGVAELRSRKQSQFVELTFGIAFAIGLAQALALVPGISRSGITITVAVLLGLSRTDAARFSFLLSIPIILAAGTLLSFELFSSDTVFSWPQLWIAVLVSAVSAWLCIELFLKFIERVGFMPFVWYRLALGTVLILIMINEVPMDG